VPTFSAASLKQLATCHPDLIRVFTRVCSSWDCTVIEGKRTEARQRVYLATGASRTMQSKHVYPLGSPSLAVDVTPYPIRWKDYLRLYAFAGFVLGVANEMGVKLRSGLDWDSDRNFAEETFIDANHFEII
jgi:peptidoglycan L-alanyl-D-glutamate endopeptidase CwlK